MAKQRKGPRPNTASGPRGSASRPSGQSSPSRTAPVKRTARTRLVVPKQRTFLRLTVDEWAIALLLVSPAMIIPDGLDRFVFGKLFVAAVGVLVAALAPAKGRLPRSVQALLAGSLVVLAVASATSATPQASFLGRQPLSEGVFVLGVYVLAGISGARLLGPGRTQRAVDVALGAMAWCAIAVALLALLESFGLRPLSSTSNRPGSLLGNASDEGAFALLYAPLLLADGLRRRKPLILAGTFGAVLTVVLSASRGALIGLAVVLVVLAVTSVRRIRTPTMIVLAVAAVASLVVPATRSRILGESPLAAHTADGRVLLWRESIRLYLRHPLFGVGPSGFENAVVDVHTRQWQTSVGPDNPPGAPHDVILQVLLVGGPLLLIALILLVVMAIRGARSAARAGDARWSGVVLTALLGYGVALLFHFPSPGTAIPAAFLAGSQLAAPVAESKAWVLGTSRASMVGVAAVLSLVFLLAGAAEIPLRNAENEVGTGRFAAANGSFETARELRPWDVDLPGQAVYAFVNAVSEGHRQAVPFAQRWVGRVGPAGDDEQLAQNRAALAQATGDYAAALTILDAQLRRDPYNPRLLVLRGVTRAEQGELSGAVSDLRLAATIDPTDPQPWQDLSLVYQSQGNNPAAAAAQRRAKQLTG